MDTRSKTDSSGLALLQLPDAFLLKLRHEHLEAEELRALMQCNVSCAKLALETQRRTNSRPALRIKTGQVKHWEGIRSFLLQIPDADICVSIDASEDSNRSSSTEEPTEQQAGSPCDLLFSSCSIPGQPAAMQKYACIVSLCLKGLSLPSILPDNIAAMCPYLVLLQITNCTIQPRQSLENSATTETAICSNLKCLQLLNVDTAGWATSMGNTPEDRVRCIKHMFPNLLHLEVEDCMQPQDLVSSLSEQLKCFKILNTAAEEVANMLNVVSKMTKLTLLQIDELRPDTDEDDENNSILEIRGFDWILPLQNLDTLALPCTVVYAKGLKQLLSLPHLTSVHVYGFVLGSEDFSQHPCTWTQLCMESPVISLRDLGQLPLHSLILGFWASPAAHVAEEDTPGTDNRQTLKLILPRGPDAVQALKKSQQNLGDCPSVYFRWRAYDVELEFSAECSEEEQVALLGQLHCYPRLASIFLRLTLDGMHITAQSLTALFDDTKNAYSAAVVFLTLANCPIDYTDAETWQKLANMREITIKSVLNPTQYLTSVRLLAQYKTVGAEYPHNETVLITGVNIDQVDSVARDIDQMPVPDHVTLTVRSKFIVPDHDVALMVVAVNVKKASNAGKAGVP